MKSSKYFKISNNIFFKVDFLHEKIIFFNDFFFKPHLLIFSFPTRPLSAPNSQNHLNGAHLRVRTPDFDCY